MQDTTWFTAGPMSLADSLRSLLLARCNRLFIGPLSCWRNRDFRGTLMFCTYSGAGTGPTVF